MTDAKITLAPDTPLELTLPADDLGTFDIEPTHSALSRWSISTHREPDLQLYADISAEVWCYNDDGDRVFVGNCVDHEPTESGPGGGDESMMEGHCRLYTTLKKAFPDSPVEFSNVSVPDALDTYFTDETPYDVTVYDPPSPVEVVSDAQLRSIATAAEWRALFGDAIDDHAGLRLDPYDAEGDDAASLALVRAAWTQEGEDTVSDTTAPAGTYYKGDSYSGGQALSIGGTTDDYGEWSFTVGQQIPGGDFELHVREDTNYDAGNGEGAPDHSWSLEYPDGSTEEIYTQSGFTKSDPSWRDLTQDFDITPSDLEPGEYRLRVDIDALSGGEERYYVDVIAPVDGRHAGDLTFDDTLDSTGGHLDGPQQYPAAQTVESETILVSANVTDLQAILSINDTQYGQAIELSNDGGSNYDTGSNTADYTASFGTAGIEARIQLTLDRYPQSPDNPQAATPRYGYNGQSISSLELRYSGDSVPVIGDVTLDDTHLDNVTTLLERGNYVFAPDHTDPDLSGEAFERGDQTRPVFWDITGRDTAIEVSETGDRREYANRVRAKGGRDESGDRIRHTVEDSAEIQQLKDDGATDEQATQEAVVSDPDLNQAETETLARATLARRRAERSDEVSIETLPIFPAPGYAYDLAEIDGTVVLEDYTVSLAVGGRSASLNFTERLRPSRSIAALRGEVERLKDVL